ncbi:mechanosensitive ion channel family protein [Pedobacter sp. MW01-1-1]|uniref:mechanosensitive ion channel family protein n=1 Tax=Pedobacter sp. MW01-1-1 TaxID=3383027 RepID=UPI003FEDAD84
MIDFSFLDRVFLGNTVYAYCLCGGILLIGFVFSRYVTAIFRKLLFGFFKEANKHADVQIFTTLLGVPSSFFVLFTSVFLALNHLTFPLNVIVFKHRIFGKTDQHLPVTLGDVLDRILLFLIILSFFWVLLRLVEFIAHVFANKALLTESKADDQLVPFVKQLSKIVLSFIGFFTLLGFVFKVNVLTLITGLGIGGIAIALAAKESLENLIGSFTIFLEKPFVVGDLVKVDGVEGTIEQVGFRSTLIRTVEKTMATIPNRGMIDGVMENMSLRNFRRVKFKIGITYETNADTIRKIVTEIQAYLDQHLDTSNDGIVYFEGFGDSSLNIELIYFITLVEYTSYLRIKEEINFKVMDIVAANKSDFAYPTQRLISDNPFVVEKTKLVGNDTTD